MSSYLDWCYQKKNVTQMQYYLPLDQSTLATTNISYANDSYSNWFFILLLLIHINRDRLLRGMCSLPLLLLLTGRGGASRVVVNSRD